jgi:hypothetical protein
VDLSGYCVIAGYSGYRFCHDGTILTQWRSGKGYNWRREESWQPLVGSFDDYGYRRASFRADDGTTAVKRLHRMSALAFFGPCPAGLEVCHADDDKQNNARENLAYGTRKQNLADAIRNGRKPCGESSHWAVLSESLVREIYRRVSEGESQTAVSVGLGVRLQTISHIVGRRTWKQLDLGPPIRIWGNPSRSKAAAKRQQTGESPS